MAGTMEGLGVPLFGGYTSYQSDGTTAYLTVNSDGTHDFTFTDEGGDYFFNVTSNQSEVQTGTMACFYGKVAETGGRTGGWALPFFADIGLAGTITASVAGMYVYISESAASTMTGSQLYGVTVTFESFGSQSDYRAAFNAFSGEASATNAASVDAGLLLQCSGSTGTFGTVLGVMGVALPAYFLHVPSNPVSYGEERMFSTGAVANVAAASKWLKVNLNDVIYWIALHASCSS